MVAIIKYNAGNITSVQNALQRLGVESIVTDDPNAILNADRVIFPGVGEASNAMRYLRSNNMDDTIKKIKKPFLGICLGLQLMCRHSEEGDTACLGIFDAKVKRFSPDLKVPHMGWNNLSETKGKILEGINTKDNLYYVHSYYAELCQSTTGICDYIVPFSAVIQKENYYGTQFHPEKSATVGLKILQNFLEL